MDTGIFYFSISHSLPRLGRGATPGRRVASATWAMNVLIKTKQVCLTMSTMSTLTKKVFGRYRYVSSPLKYQVVIMHKSPKFTNINVAETIPENINPSL